jgi:hypothetical protein
MNNNLVAAFHINPFRWWRRWSTLQRLDRAAHTKQRADPGMVIEQEGEFYFATKPVRHSQEVGRHYLGWVKRGPITGSGPLDEPGDPVYFQFGDTRESVIVALKQELSKVHA